MNKSVHLCSCYLLHLKCLVFKLYSSFEPGVWIRKDKEQTQRKKYSPKADDSRGAEHIDVLRQFVFLDQKKCIPWAERTFRCVSEPRQGKC